MWYVSSNRDESRYEDPDRFDVERNPEHQAFGAGGRHFCLGAALARLELRILFEETLKRYPRDRARRRRREYAESPFVNQLNTLPVRTRPAGVARTASSATLPPHCAPPARAVAPPWRPCPPRVIVPSTVDANVTLAAVSL